MFGPDSGNKRYLEATSILPETPFKAGAIGPRESTPQHPDGNVLFRDRGASFAILNQRENPARLLQAEKVEAAALFRYQRLGD